mmetsp:Transcript_3375/g.5668  ORF Transcript_3375/g.5668 Transcript_3375/m.5668 type:complete len:124 (+) Transcript_3375:22-393(+)
MLSFAQTNGINSTLSKQTVPNASSARLRSTTPTPSAAFLTSTVMTSKAPLPKALMSSNAHIGKRDAAQVPTQKVGIKFVSSVNRLGLESDKFQKNSVSELKLSNPPVASPPQADLANMMSFQP